MPSKNFGARLRGGKRFTPCQLRQNEGRATARDERLMMLCLDVRNRDSAGFGNDLGRYGVAGLFEAQS